MHYLNTSIILLQKVSTAASIDAIAGIRNTVVTEDYRGVKALSAYGPISFGNRQWGLLSEIDTEEAFFAVHQLSRSLLLSAVILALVMGFFWRCCGSEDAATVGRFVSSGSRCRHGESLRRIRCEFQ